MSKMITHQTGKMTQTATPSQNNKKLTKKAPLTGVNMQTKKMKARTWYD